MIKSKKNKKETPGPALKKNDTDRKSDAEEIFRTKELFQKTFESQLDAIFILDTSIPAKIIDCNPAALKMFGYARDELIGNATEILHVDKRQWREFRSRLLDNIQKKGHFRLNKFQMKRKDGSAFHTVHSVMPLLYENGNMFGWVSVVNDITELVFAENKLIEYQNNLEALVEKRTNLLIQANEALRMEIIERKNAELEIEKRKQALEEMNSALAVLLRKREHDKSDLEEKIVMNVKNLILPYLENLKKSVQSDEQKTWLRLIESNFKDILSPLPFNLFNKFNGLTQTEIKISDLIKNGETNKEIAEILHISIKTVEFHRDNIRKKLGIKNQKINLQSFLLSLS